MAYGLKASSCHPLKYTFPISYICYSGHLIGVRMKSPGQMRLFIHTQFDHYTKNSELYVAAWIAKDVVNRNPEFLVGDGKTYGMYYNPPLMKGATYILYTAFVSQINETVCNVAFNYLINIIAFI